MSVMPYYLMKLKKFPFSENFDINPSYKLPTLARFV